MALQLTWSCTTEGARGWCAGQRGGLEDVADLGSLGQHSSALSAHALWPGRLLGHRVHRRYQANHLLLLTLLQCIDCSVTAPLTVETAVPMAQ